MKLLVFKGGEQVQELELLPGSSYKVGRKEGSDIELEKLPGISRNHFVIESDEGGGWNLQVVSNMRMVHYRGQDCQQVHVTGNARVTLTPYEFQFLANDNMQSMTPVDEASFAPTADNFESFEDSESGDEDNQHTFIGNEEKTQIQNLNSIPYIKLVGQNGKKSEYFRLEGSLWIAGSDDNASIVLNDPQALPNHFEISKTDRGFFIADLGSTIGTQLNGQILSPRTPTQILSGDVIVVGSQSLQFELRDQSFKRKVNNIPLHMYQNPLVFFDQEVGMMTTMGEETVAGRAEEVQMDLGDDKKKKKKIWLAFAAVLVFAVAGISLLDDSSDSNKSANSESLDPFAKLDPEQKKLVVRTYNLSKNLYLNANFELALVQLQKLHSVIPEYKDSREMEEYCINSRDLKRQQALIEQQRKEQEEMEEQVQSILAQCAKQFNNSYDLDGAQACLSPAVSMDPSNPQINEILSNIKARIEERSIRMKAMKEQEERIRRGQDLFKRAKELHAKNKLHKAIEAYENHIHSGLPDPKGLVKESERNLAAIEKNIEYKKRDLVSTAISKYEGANLKEAIEIARKAQKVDPYDHTISNFILKAEKELTSKMKNIYMDSVIEERFGNLEASRTKWEEIVRQDVDGGVYHEKAKGKLKQYGF
ncbi:MAG: FHA domain-containing protein [Bdellovibrionales bacterium]|nr:FHA domain-containing protein [Bdellovibrionales bacterium]